VRDASDLTWTLGPDGPLAAHVPGFAPREAQQAMAEAVAATLEQGTTLIAEAGTGTGKTFAYLVPALLSGRKVVVSTGTKNLQDQLFHKDLPVVRGALGVPVTTALLKGRANYLCLHRLDLTEAEGRLPSRAAVDELRRVREWSGRTQRGDIAELSDVAEDSAIWPRVTSTADNCLGQECPAFADCFLMKARRAAQEADVVVINHHLLFADMALRDEGFGELLPRADAVIVDEAHQLAEVAGQFFGISLSANQLLELARDAASEYQRECAEDAALPKLAEALQKAVRDARLAFGTETRRAAWREVAGRADVVEAFETLHDALEALVEALEPLAARGKGLESCARRGAELLERLDLLQGRSSGGSGGDEPGTRDGGGAQVEPDHIQWFETHTRSFTLHLTPLDIAERFRGRMLDAPGAWVFTSATLAVGEDFGHFANALGLEEATTRRWDSPFDFAHQALFLVPRGLPAPNAPDYTAQVVETARPVLAASGGRAFLLFTSHRALREAAGLLADSLDYPLLVQGDAPRDTLLARFRKLGNAVLLGTSSFWEGVDVRGEALSCVIIDKLPFASPGEPVLQARIDAMRRRGGNPFMDYQLPNAVIALKQGVGRLIRDVNDRGVLVICDPRLLGKPYGRIFLASLPPMARTRDVADVERFFETGQTPSPRADRAPALGASEGTPR